MHASLILLVDVTKALCQRERGDVKSQHSNGLLNSFDDWNLAIDNTGHLSNAKTMSQACVNVLIKGR